MVAGYARMEMDYVQVGGVFLAVDKLVTRVEGNTVCTYITIINRV